MKTNFNLPDGAKIAFIDDELVLTDNNGLSSRSALRPMELLELVVFLLGLSEWRLAWDHYSEEKPCPGCGSHWTDDDRDALVEGKLEEKFGGNDHWRRRR